MRTKSPWWRPAMWCISAPAWCITCSIIRPTWNIWRSCRRPTSALSPPLPPPTRCPRLGHGNDSIHRRYDTLRRGAQPFDDGGLTRPVGRAVGPEDIVEPKSRRLQGIGPLPAVPRHVGLGLAVHKAPIDHADIAALADGQDGVEGRAGAPRHIFGADERAAIDGECAGARLEGFRPAVIVKADDIGLGELGLFHGIEVFQVIPVAVIPDAAGQGL